MLRCDYSIDATFGLLMTLEGAFLGAAMNLRNELADE